MCLSDKIIGRLIGYVHKICVYAYSHTKYTCAKGTLLWPNVKSSINIPKRFWVLSTVKRCIDFGILYPFRRNLHSSYTSVNNTGSFFSVEKMLDITILITSDVLYSQFCFIYFYVILCHNKRFCRIELSKCWLNSSSEPSSTEGGAWSGACSPWELRGHWGGEVASLGDQKRLCERDGVWVYVWIMGKILTTTTTKKPRESHSRWGLPIKKG